jgi:Mn-containing catalase
MSPPNPASPVYAELLDLLHQAVTIEQALMLQYLYAAFPLKKKYEALRGQGWLSEHYDLLGITIEEMRHLHLVSLLLARLKQSPQLKPLAFPFELKRYGLKMDLHWLDSQRLAQYVFV